MNKQVLITLAVIVGLLALWLIIAVLYPRGEEPTDMMETEEGTEEGAVAAPSGTVTATVQIVESLDDIPQEQPEAVEATVDIE